MRWNQLCQTWNVTMLVEERTQIELEDGKLDGRLIYPELPPVNSCVLLAPPHPLLGGDVDNPALRAMAEGIASAGAAILCISYRSAFLGGRGTVSPNPQDNELASCNNQDLKDMNEALDWLKGLARPSARCLAVAGYSYGGALAIVAGGNLPVFALSPPLRALATIDSCSLRNIFLVKAADDFAISQREVDVTQTERRQSFRRVEIIDGADHFYRGHLKEVKEVAYLWASELSR